jgi:D-3-phosphoglycerate dehydrogenase
VDSIDTLTRKVSDVEVARMADDSAGDQRPRGLVVVTAPGFDSDGPTTGSLLHAAGFTIENHGPSGGRSEADMINLLAHADAAILSSDPITDAVLDACPRLRVIARSGVGTDSIDLVAATRRGVIVTTTPGLNDETCADHTVALMLGTLRRIAEHDASVRRGEWNRGGSLMPWDLHGKRVGVIGYGRIGRCVVRRLLAFTSEVRVFDPVASVDAELLCPDLTELLGWADVLTLHAPLTEQTRGLLGRNEFASMRSGIVVVNTSRGSLIDEIAFLEALQSGHVRAAAVDVFDTEPPSNSALLNLPNVTLSPHIGGLSVEAVGAIAERCVQQVLTVMDGQTPVDVVNPAVFEAPVRAVGDEHSRSPIGAAGSGNE